MTDQEDLGVSDQLLFRQLLAKMIDLKIVKYVDRVEDGVKRRYFWR